MDAARTTPHESAPLHDGSPRALESTLQALGEAYEANVAAASADWSLPVADAAALGGLDAHDLARARRRAEASGRDGYLITLDAPMVDAVLARCDDRELRRVVYEAYATRASDHGPRAGHFDNTALVERILGLRHALAQALGHANHAERARAGTPIADADDVERLIMRDARAAKARAQSELDALWAFAKEKGVPKGFAVWDLPYYTARRAREELGFDPEAFRPYLGANSVVAGLVSLVRRLLGVTLTPLSGVPEAGLRSYAVTSGTGRGVLELALQERADSWRGASLRAMPSEGGLPVLRVRCALDPDDAPAFDVATLAAFLRGVGAALFALCSPLPTALAEATLGSALTQALFAQLLAEPWGWAALCSRDGATIPAELVEGALRAREQRASLDDAVLRERALFDLRLHRDYIPADKATRLRVHVRDTLAQVRSETCVLRPPFWERMAQAATDIFASAQAGRVWYARWAGTQLGALWEPLRSGALAPAEVEPVRAVLRAHGALLPSAA